MLITPSFKKNLTVEQFQENYLKGQDSHPCHPYIKFMTFFFNLLQAIRHRWTRGSWFTIFTLFMTKTYSIYDLTENLKLDDRCSWQSCPKDNLTITMRKNLFFFYSKNIPKSKLCVGEGPDRLRRYAPCYSPSRMKEWAHGHKYFTKKKLERFSGRSDGSKCMENQLNHAYP